MKLKSGRKMVYLGLDCYHGGWDQVKANEIREKQDEVQGGSNLL